MCQGTKKVSHHWSMSFKKNFESSVTAHVQWIATENLTTYYRTNFSYVINYSTFYVIENQCWVCGNEEQKVIRKIERKRSTTYDGIQAQENLSVINLFLLYPFRIAHAKLSRNKQWPYEEHDTNEPPLFANHLTCKNKNSSKPHKKEFWDWIESQ